MIFLSLIPLVLNFRILNQAWIEFCFKDFFSLNRDFCFLKSKILLHRKRNFFHFIDLSSRFCSTKSEDITIFFIEKRMRNLIGFLDKFVRVAIFTNEDKSHFLPPKNSKSSSWSGHHVILFRSPRSDQHSLLV